MKSKLIKSSKFLILLTLMLGFIQVKSQNPICPPGLNIADPTTRVWNDGKLYVYGSRDDNPKRYCSHDHWVLSTSDLINWEYFPDAFNTTGPKDKLPYNDKVLYAPDIMYKEGMYYLYFCQPNKGNFEGVATSTSPTGPFENAKPMNVPLRYDQIDPAVFIDDDGQAYYLWGQFKCKIAKLNANMTEIDTTTIVDAVVTAKEHFFHEGSYMIKRNGIYYLIYADESRHGHPTCIGYSTSNSPFGPYKYGGVIVDNYGCNPGNHNNHGSIVEFKGQWYVFYHRSTHGSKMMRKACIEPIKFNPDGSISEVEMTSQGAGDPLDAFSKIEAERACLLNGNVRIETYAFDPTNLISPDNNDQLCKIFDNDYAAYKYIDFGKGANSVSLSVNQGLKPGKIELYIDSIGGKSIGYVPVDGNGDNKTWSTITSEIVKTEGVHALYLKFNVTDSISYTIDWFKFEK